MTSVSQFSQLGFTQPVMVSDFVQDRDADLAAQFILVDLPLFVPRHSQNPKPVEMNHIGQHAPLLNASLRERNPRVKPTECVSPVDTQLAKHFGRRKIFDDQRQFVEHVLNVLRQLAEHVFKHSIEAVAKLRVHALFSPAVPLSRRRCVSLT